jgi:recombination protein RecR
MHYYPPSIRNLIREISRLPGIGEKTAERLAMHLLKGPKAEAERLARSIMDIRERTRRCSRCFALSDGELCPICSDPGRQQDLLCVVEHPGDMIAIEKSGAYPGVYHVLNGVLSPLNGIGPEDIRLRELMGRVAAGDILEVVIATGTGVEGEATAAFIAESLRQWPIRATRIASGVPVGGDLKYVDQVTLKRAMEFRHAFQS